VEDDYNDAAAATLICALPIAVRDRAAYWRRHPEWTFGSLPPSYAVDHAAAELLGMPGGFLEQAQKLPPPYCTFVGAFLTAFLRVATERAALDGDENALAELPTLPQPSDDDMRQKAEEALEQALAPLPEEG
jgi:hypothetical protein